MLCVGPDCGVSLAKRRRLDLVGLGLLAVELGCILLVQLVLTRLEARAVVLLQQSVRAAKLAVTEGAVAHHAQGCAGAAVEGASLLLLGGFGGRVAAGHVAADHVDGFGVEVELLDGLCVVQRLSAKHQVDGGGGQGGVALVEVLLDGGDGVGGVHGYVVRLSGHKLDSEGHGRDGVVGLGVVVGVGSRTIL